VDLSQLVPLSSLRFHPLFNLTLSLSPTSQGVCYPFNKLCACFTLNSWSGVFSHPWCQETNFRSIHPVSKWHKRGCLNRVLGWDKEESSMRVTTCWGGLSSNGCPTQIAEMRVLQTICLGWPQIVILPISTSPVPRITRVSHHAQLFLYHHYFWVFVDVVVLVVEVLMRIIKIRFTFWQILSLHHSTVEYRCCASPFTLHDGHPVPSPPITSVRLSHSMALWFGSIFTISCVQVKQNT
jgi:hypothetical protein